MTTSINYFHTLRGPLGVMGASVKGEFFLFQVVVC